MGLLHFVKSFLKLLRSLRLLNYFMWSVSLGMYIIFRIRNNIKIIGAKNVPKRGPMILIMNHSSGLDAFLALGVIFGRLGHKFVSVANERSFKNDTFERAFLLALDMIPRIGTGNQIMKKLAQVICNQKNVGMVPEGMLNDGKIMKAYTGTTRLYYFVNSHPKIHCPIVPVATIGAFEAYPPYREPDGSYKPKKGGIIMRIGKPFHLPPIPKDVDKKKFFREQTDAMMNILCKLALQKEGVVDSWKIDSISHDSTQRKYTL
jgi:1-acyl-sn-glycerol-3-phosphate acyltransferase